MEKECYIFHQLVAKSISFSVGFLDNETCYNVAYSPMIGDIFYAE